MIDKKVVLQYALYDEYINRVGMPLYKFDLQTSFTSFRQTHIENRYCSKLTAPRLLGLYCILRTGYIPDWLKYVFSLFYHPFNHSVVMSSPQRGRMDGWVRVLRLFQQYFSHFEMMEGWTWKALFIEVPFRFGRILPLAGFEQATPWSEVGSTNRSATSERGRRARKNDKPITTHPFYTCCKHSKPLGCHNQGDLGIGSYPAPADQ